MKTKKSSIFNLEELERNKIKIRQRDIYTRMVEELLLDKRVEYFEIPITLQSLKKLRFLNELKLQPNELVLDIGCYKGDYSRFLAKKYKTHCLGIDISTSCIEYSRKCDDYNNVYLVADAENIPFKNNVFDLVLASSVLEHVPDLHRCLVEAYRILKTGGKILIMNTPLKDDRYSLVWVLNKIKPTKLKKVLESIGHDYERLLSWQELLSLVKNKGFHIIKKERCGVFVQPIHDWYILPFLINKIYKPLRDLRFKSTKRRPLCLAKKEREENFLEYSNYKGGIFRKIYSASIIPVLKLLVLFEKLVTSGKLGYCAYILAIKKDRYF
jgi:ubiquinone/menaquinone biosynthesis C-methylase UbiE